MCLTYTVDNQPTAVSTAALGAGAGAATPANGSYVSRIKGTSDHIPVPVSPLSPFSPVSPLSPLAPSRPSRPTLPLHPFIPSRPFSPSRPSRPRRISGRWVCGPAGMVLVGGGVVDIVKLRWKTNEVKVLSLKKKKGGGGRADTQRITKNRGSSKPACLQKGERVSPWFVQQKTTTS
ncbi:hypothetical protein B0T25DRAFT_151930 [Lasiosphaeria hispida]|uniref:Uncharacterized protein n=1 Tax=Lasiosphaeria hispida TaxID=260671 RepID=A0AAJ0HME8_9PEZI|nr:hypothetical protein B0T25DRAFT_151930 [Lasiosphaeria hispida]